MRWATYVLFSPLGLRNQDAMEKTLMKMMLTRIDQLRAVSATVVEEDAMLPTRLP